MRWGMHASCRASVSPWAARVLTGKGGTVSIGNKMRFNSTSLMELAAAHFDPWQRGFNKKTNLGGNGFEGKKKSLGIGHGLVSPSGWTPNAVGTPGCPCPLPSLGAPFPLCSQRENMDRNFGSFLPNHAWLWSHCPGTAWRQCGGPGGVGAPRELATQTARLPMLGNPSCHITSHNQPRGRPVRIQGSWVPEGLSTPPGTSGVWGGEGAGGVSWKFEPSSPHTSLITPSCVLRSL